MRHPINQGILVDLTAFDVLVFSRRVIFWDIFLWETVLWGGKHSNLNYNNFLIQFCYLQKNALKSYCLRLLALSY